MTDRQETAQAVDGKQSKLTPKQERFAQVYVETSNASEAYRQAYDVQPDTLPTSIWVNASKTLSDAKVAQRVMELQETNRDKHSVTVESIAAEYEEARFLGKTEKQASAMVSATTGKAKLYGLIIDKADTKTTIAADDSVAAVMGRIAGGSRKIPSGD